MKSIERLGTKVFLFVILSGLLNYYVLSQLFNLFSLERGTLFLTIWIAGSVSYLLGAELLRHFNNWFIKMLNVIFSTWLGIAFTFLWMFAIFELANLIYPLNFHIYGFVIFAIVLILVIYSIYNSLTFNVRTIRVESEKLKKPLRVVQLSDLHIGSTHMQNFLSNTVDRVNELDPDFVVITGDLLDGMHHYNDDEFMCLNRIKAPVYFVLGNHEQFIDISRVYNLLEKTHLRFLRNVAVIHEGIQIIGLDDTSSRDVFLRNLSNIAIDHNKFTLLLYHRPHMFYDAAKEDVDLMLSGHTHGGQLFPINLILKIFDGPVQGLHKLNNTYLYVSTGTGWWGPPMRLGSRNEITLIDLIPQYIEHPDYPVIEKIYDKEHHHHSNNHNSNSSSSTVIETKNRKISTKTAEIISLIRGKKGLMEDKHDKVLFDVDLLANTNSELENNNDFAKYDASTQDSYEQLDEYNLETIVKEQSHKKYNVPVVKNKNKIKSIRNKYRKKQIIHINSNRRRKLKSITSKANKATSSKKENLSKSKINSKATVSNSKTKDLRSNKKLQTKSVNTHKKRNPSSKTNIKNKRK